MSSITHTVYFVRHGQCRGNVTGETLSPEDDVITDFGREQSAALGEYLKDVKFTKRYSSTYSRAYETAKEILAKSTKSCSTQELKYDKRIIERDMGDLIGCTAKEIGLKVIGQLQEGKKFNELEVPGGESVAEYNARLHGFFKDLFDELRKSTSPENVLIVSHGLAMRRILVGFEEDFSDICTLANRNKKCRSIIENTACTTFTLEYKENAEETKPLLTFLKVHDTDHVTELNEKANTNPDGTKKASKFALNDDDRKMAIQMVMQIPGAKEEMSGCVQV